MESFFKIDSIENRMNDKNKTKKQLIEELEDSRNQINELERNSALPGQGSKREHKSERFHRAIIDTSPDGIFTLSTDGTITSLNPAFEKITGWPTGKWIGKSFDEIIHPDDRATAIKKYQQVLNGETTQPFEIRVFSNSGNEVTAEFLATPQMQDGKVVSVLGFAHNITERKKAEEMRRESDERYRALFERSLESVYLLDFEGNFLDANQATLDLLGYERDEILFINFTSLLCEEQHQEEYTLLNELLEKGDTEDAVQGPKKYKIKRKDGSFIWIELKDSLIFKDEKPYAVQGIARDITGRRKAEGEMHRIKDSAIASSINAITLIDLEGKLIYVNRSFLHMWEYHTEDEVLDSPAALLLKNREEVAEVRKIIRDRGDWSGEIVARRKDGSEFYSRISASMVTDNNNVPLCIMASFLDISKQKLAEKALHDSRQRFKELVELLPQFVFEIDMNGNFTFTNNYGLETFGYSREELRGKTRAMHVVVPEDRERVIEDSRKVIAGEDIGGKEYTLQRKDGAALPVLLHISPIIKDEKTMGLRGIAIDITELKDAENRLKSSIREKVILLTEVHHRVKNNMQVISSLLSLQASRIEDPIMKEKILESQKRIHSMALIHEMLYHSENFSSINFHSYIENLSKNLFQLYRINPAYIQLNMNIDNSINIGIDNAVPCGLMINEILTNSLKHAFPEGSSGTIDIIIRKTVGNTISLSIADNGAGFRDNTDWHEAKTLGLVIIRSLARQLRGSIEVNCENGTEIMITFPL